MIMFEDFCNNSFVISISDNRLERFYERFRKSGFNVLPKKIEGCRFKQLGNKKGESIAVSRFFALKLAKFLNLPFIVVFEDDALPCKDCIEKLQKTLNYINSNEFDAAVLGLGFYLRRGQTLIEKDSIVQPFIYDSVASYMVFSKYYDYILERYQTAPFKRFDHFSIRYALKDDLEKSFVTSTNMFFQYNEDNDFNCDFTKKNVLKLSKEANFELPEWFDACK